MRLFLVMVINGEIKVEVTSGTGPYMYAWDGSAGNQTTAIATNVGVGSYTIVVMDLSMEMLQVLK